MSLTLHVDAARWRDHLDAVTAATPGLVPVAKGNGYGFGLGLLAAEAARLGADVLAVGLASEVDQVRDAGWDADIVVLSPWRHVDATATALLDDPRVITTVSGVDDLARLGHQAPGVRVLLEVQTSMRRHGMPTDNLPRVRGLLDAVTVEGWTIHLPMVGDRAAEARDLAASALAQVRAPLWLSHLSASEVARLGTELDIDTRLRMGTNLWLYSPALRTTATVLDLHPVRRGEQVGYWQHRVPSDGWLAVVSGGTAHGVALSAPSPGHTLRQRATTLATGALDAAGHALSPYTLGGRKRSFIEPPHMQASLVFIPGSCPVAVGEEVPVELRLTTAHVDQIVFGG